MKHKLLEKEKMDEIYHELLDHGFVESGHEDVDNFLDELGGLLNHNKHFKKIKHHLKEDPKFRQRFEEELKRLVLEG